MESAICLQEEAHFEVQTVTHTVKALAARGRLLPNLSERRSNHEMTELDFIVTEVANFDEYHSSKLTTEKSPSPV